MSYSLAADDPSGPLSLASAEYGADEDHVEDDVAAAVAESAAAGTSLEWLRRA